MKPAAPRAWNIVDAKAHLSEVVAAACDTGEPQRIAKRGRVVAVVVDSERYGALEGAAREATPESAWQTFLAHAAELRREGGATIRAPRRKDRRKPKLGD